MYYQNDIVGEGDPTVTDIRCIQYLPSGDVQYKLRHADEWQTYLTPHKISTTR